MCTGGGRAGSALGGHVLSDVTEALYILGKNFQARLFVAGCFSWWWLLPPVYSRRSLPHSFTSLLGGCIVVEKWSLGTTLCHLSAVPPCCLGLSEKHPFSAREQALIHGPDYAGLACSLKKKSSWSRDSEGWER